MSISRQEEIISVLWIIAAILAFGHGFTVWGWVFAIKAAIDTACTIYCIVLESLLLRHNAELRREL